MLKDLGNFTFCRLRKQPQLAHVQSMKSMAGNLSLPCAVMHAEIPRTIPCPRLSQALCAPPVSQAPSPNLHKDTKTEA
jgi:hypothetical protein